MTGYFFVFLGGGLGSMLRYGIGHLLSAFQPSFPLATFLANALSCIVLGLLTGIAFKGDLATNYRLLLMTGFCGGFSTFSTFSNETFQLFQQGYMMYGFANIALSLIVCLACIYLGMKLVV